MKNEKETALEGLVQEQLRDSIVSTIGNTKVTTTKESVVIAVQNKNHHH